MKKLAIYVFYVIIGLSTAFGVYSIITAKGDVNFNSIGLMILFISISCISIYFLKNKSDDTLF